MKKLIIILVSCLLLSSCNCGLNHHFKKPFVIVEIDNINNGWTSKPIDTTETIYTYQDVEGITWQFIDKANKYSIGDTIK